VIQATIKRNQQQEIISVEITGHADFAAYGSDIVCAGVSALVANTINSIEKLAGYRPILEVNETDGGYLYCETPAGLSGKQRETTQVLFESLLIGLQSVAEEYDKYIKIMLV